MYISCSFDDERARISFFMSRGISYVKSYYIMATSMCILVFENFDFLYLN